MQIKAIWRSAGRSALILATGFWIGGASPVSIGAALAQNGPATVTAAPDKPMSLKKFTRPAKYRKSSRNRSRDNGKVARQAHVKDHGNAAKVSRDGSDIANKNAPEASGLSERNANAQASMTSAAGLLATTTTVGAASDMAPASERLKEMGGEAVAPRDARLAPAEDPNVAHVIPADQLNELDKSVTAGPDKPDLVLASATLDAPQTAVSTANEAWDRTSLIGRIFIAFGGLLTVASVARMLIA